MRNAECGMRNQKGNGMRLLHASCWALRTPHSTLRTARAGFTLIELLVVMGIIAILATMLLPTIFSVSQQSKIANTDALLKRLAVSLDVYFKSFAYYPPDYLPTAAQIINFDGRTTGSPPSYIKITLGGPAYCSETLYYFLCHRFLTGEPMLQLKASECADINENGIPEVVDAWARPILYNRPKFPACADTYYNFAGNPKHNAETFDLYSVGPDGQTGANDLLPFSVKTMADFHVKAMDNTNDGTGDDDLRNWTK